MRILKDFKVPNFKFPKFKMKEMTEIEELKVDIEAIKANAEKKDKKRNELYPIRNFKTVKDIFNYSTVEFAKYPFILEKNNHKEPFKEITFEQFGKDVTALGTAMIDILKLKDKRVVIIGENTYHWYITYMALLCGVGIAVPVDKELPTNELENVIRRARATAVVYSTKKKDTIKSIMDNLPGVEFFIQMNSEQDIDGKNVGVNHLINVGNELVDKGSKSLIDAEIDPESFNVLLFTSGTTSNSKGVMLCQRNLAENVNSAMAYVHIDINDRLLSMLPLHHTYESSIGFLLPLGTGTSVAICEGLKYIVPNLKEAQPTAILTVPILVENLYKKINANIKKSKKDKLVNSMIHVTNALKSANIDIKRKVFSEIYENLGGKLRIIVSAAAPIDYKIGKWVEDIGITFLQGYGLTETAPIAALTPDFNTKVGSAGKAVYCAEIKIDNPNENGEGEIMIKSKTLMLGYYEDEKATKEAITEDGWFYSGDVGYLDKEGFLFITGRSKNVIVTQNGKNIYPEEIELMLSNVKEISECMVYGKEDTESKGNKELIITAKIIPDYVAIEEIYGAGKTEAEIEKILWEKIKETNRKLTSYKAIKKIEIKKDEFEKTTTMKIKRFAEIKKDEETNKKK